MKRKLLGTYAILAVGGAVAWAAQGFPRFDPTRLGLAALFLVVCGFLIWLKWDVARARQVDELLKKHDQPRP